MSSIATRRREFAMLEAIGMTKKQLKKMIMYENILLIIQWKRPKSADRTLRR